MTTNEKSLGEKLLEVRELVANGTSIPSAAFACNVPLNTFRWRTSDKTFYEYAFTREQALDNTRLVEIFALEQLRKERKLLVRCFACRGIGSVTVLVAGGRHRMKLGCLRCDGKWHKCSPIAGVRGEVSRG